MPHIVVIDDEKEIAVMLERFFKAKDGFSVQSFTNPNSVLSHIDSKVDLVLLDIMMPQINGLDLLPKLMERNPNVKVIMMTAYSTLDKVLNAHRYGATEYVMKPFSSLTELGKKVDEVLEK